MASFRDLIPLRDRAGPGEVTLARPAPEEVERQTEKTKEALQLLINGASAAQKPSLIKKQRSDEPTYVRYTPADQFGEKSSGRERLIKIQNSKADPMEPPKHKFKRIPGGPPSPPRPILHSPTRRATAAEQAEWRIPPSVSSWKNPKGFTRGIDKLLVARPQLEDVTISNRFSDFAEALFTADRHAREEVKQRATMQQRLAEKEKQHKEDHLRMLAQKAREERSANTHRGRRESIASSRGSSRSDSASSADSGARDRERARRERRQEREKQLRQSRMGTERKMQMLAREQNRDISEKIALGLAKPTQSSESMYDSRLFNQTSGFDTGFNEDQPYDKPLFAAQDTINSIYRPTHNQDEDVEADAGATMEKIEKASRFEVLGKAAKGFRGADMADERRGPVEFERDKGAAISAAGAGGSAAAGRAPETNDDPFEIDAMIKEVIGGGGGNGKKRSGDDDDRGHKRARVDSDED
ncbi:mRNA splicing protein [Thelotrema lepadinum]|nr:mRNA splicing protein [Thelotrema lepadinum]